MTKAKGAPKKTVLFGIGAAIILLLLTLVIYQVDSTEYAVVTQFGQPVRVVEDAGLKIKLPDPIQSVQRLDKRVQVYQTSSIELLTLDRLNVSLDYYGTWKIVDPILFLQTVRDNIGAEARLLDVFSSSLSVQLGQYKLEQLVNTDAEKLELDTMIADKVCPYLLRNAVINKPNQAWSVDITYIPIKRGFLYLTAVIDWYSRCIVGWEVDDTLDTRMVINALKKAFKMAKPQILNSDQGCQFTSQQYIDFVKENGIRQSMDGKSRWADNIMIERWFRSFKYEEAYLTQYNNIKEARAAIGAYIHTYNFERRHSALDYQTPAECYYPAMLLPYVA